MQKLIILINVLVLLFSVSGCAKEVKKNDRPERPEWIDKPEPNFVGRCETHVTSVIEQEKCAYKEGLASIVSSKGIAVNASVTMTNNQTAVEKNITVSVTVIDKWHDKSAGIMYVLIKEN